MRSLFLSCPLTDQQLHHRNQLRKSLRKQRKALSLRATRQAGQQATITLSRQPFFVTATHIGLYIAAFGEVDTAYLCQLAWQQGKQVWLPRINPYNLSLTWQRYTPALQRSRRRYRHRLGMYEYSNAGACINTQQLDLLIMPLLAFDAHGNRLGMGGGFYDRTLAKLPRFATKPLRLGLAYPFQQVAPLTSAPWDQAMHAILTPNHVIRTK